ncbi:hypothetical protein EV383_4667 [Pseudonocardia sediminis]|uniref:Uncharacterized protein n=1 Tax=Pseudonocardia sediminis TaxID=1397368 RepID=A0A4Q7V2V1_PSEST|nr:hypothetical protein [Pseudonocardia sediminis]RZT87741.1 hypothetical protein EV383_4667 [Pseudonocardia sediminis]
MTDEPVHASIRPVDGPDAHAADVAAAVLGHPAVIRLDGGPFGSIASYLPGHHLAGVRVGLADEPTEVAVVVRLGHPFPGLADEIAGRVRSVLGPVAVEVTFSDVGAADAVSVPARQEPWAGRRALWHRGTGADGPA